MRRDQLRSNDSTGGLQFAAFSRRLYALPPSSHSGQGTSSQGRGRLVSSMLEGGENERRTHFCRYWFVTVA
jgi:hypothetical protein